MSATDNTIRQWREETSAPRRASLGAIRRMAVTLTSGVFWQVLGHLLLDGVTKETLDAEVFSGVGFYSRPKAGHQVDALVVFPGGSSNPVIIATRDEDARKAIAKLADDETAAFNSSTIIVIKKDRTVEIRQAGGTAVALATKADVQAVVDIVNHHVHLYLPGPGASTPTSTIQVMSTAVPPAPVAAAAPSPVGTEVLKAQ